MGEMQLLQKLDIRARLVGGAAIDGGRGPFADAVDGELLQVGKRAWARVTVEPSGRPPVRGC